MRGNLLHLVQDYEDIAEEQWYINVELNSLDSKSLVEEVMFLLDEYDCPEAEKIVRDYYLSQEISRDKMNKLRGLYILVWSHFFLEE